MSAIPNLAFSHIGIFVTDIALMRRFYIDTLGFTLTDEGKLDTPNGPLELAFLSRDPSEHHQLVLATGRPEGLDFNVVNQISFRVADVPALQHFYHALADTPVTDIAPVTHGNAISLYFRDPEGNRLELFLDTPWYCQQPCREPIDLTQDAQAIMDQTEQIARSLPGFTTREAWMTQLRTKIQS